MQCMTVRLRALDYYLWKRHVSKWIGGGQLFLPNGKNNPGINKSLTVLQRSSRFRCWNILFPVESNSICGWLQDQASHYYPLGYDPGLSLLSSQNGTLKMTSFWKYFYKLWKILAWNLYVFVSSIFSCVWMNSDKKFGQHSSRGILVTANASDENIEMKWNHHHMSCYKMYLSTLSLPPKIICLPIDHLEIQLKWYNFFLCKSFSY